MFFSFELHDRINFRVYSQNSTDIFFIILACRLIRFQKCVVFWMFPLSIQGRVPIETNV